MNVTTGAAISASVDEGALISTHNPGGTDPFTFQNPNLSWQDGNDPGQPLTASGSLASFVAFGADGGAAVNLAATTPTGAFQFTFTNNAGATTFVTGLSLTSHGDAVNTATLSIVNGVETL